MPSLTGHPEDFLTAFATESFGASSMLFAVNLDFMTFLPRVAPPPAAAATPARGPDEPPAGHPSSMGPLSILLVEDEKLIRELIAEYLGFSGYEVIAAESPRQAIELLEGGALQAVRLVISDVLMPGLSGVELIRILAARLPGVKLLLMSGFPGQSPCEEIAIDPCTPYLEKPFTMEALAARVRLVLAEG